VAGDLVPEDLIVGNNSTQVGNSTIGQGFAGFKGWFDGLSTLFQGLVSAGMAVAAAAVVIVLIVIIVKSIRAFKIASLQRKFEDLEASQKQDLINKSAMKNLSNTDFR
jgi:hypothetical protein